MIFAVAVRVLADVSVEEPGFVADYRGVSVLELDLGVFGGLDFGTGKDHPRLETVHKEVVMARLAVVTENFKAAVFLGQFFALNTRKPKLVKEVRCSWAIQAQFILAH